MSAKFDAFVLFAEMRTGSNHLEASLDALADVTGHGELFNPVFIGKHNRDELLGIDLAARAADPGPLLERVIAQAGLPGFRYFHDHDPRVLARVLETARIGKVILTRNPLESYVSLAIARETGQWRLTNPKMAKAAKIRFDAAAFDRLVARQAAFRDRVTVALQRSGQSAFWISYDQIGDLEVVNGLAAWLGSADRLDALPGKLKRQNPGSVEDKVENPEEMHAHLARLDPFLLARPAAPDAAPEAELSWLAAAGHSPLIHLGLPGGPGERITRWLQAVDGSPPQQDMDARDLRRWLRQAKGFVSFCVLRHPLARAWAAWGDVQSATGPDANKVRRVITNQHGVALDGDPAEAFAGFLRFLGAVRGGQSALPVAPAWEGQAELLAGLAQVLIPQRVIREAEAQPELDRLAMDLGQSSAPLLPGEGTGPTLSEIYQPEHDDLAVAAYRRDYRQFGFRRWANS